MYSIELFHDLYAHMEWGDAEIWAAIQRTPEATENEQVHKLLFHIHMTQWAFFNAWRGEPFARVKPEDYPTLDDVKVWKTSFYNELKPFLESLKKEQLSEPLVLPWAPYFARSLGREFADTTLGETMHQLASHSVHHRAQVNTLLRQLGGEPPMIDYILWIWMGRPTASWDT